jgi:hypothetical protein
MTRDRDPIKLIKELKSVIPKNYSRWYERGSIHEQFDDLIKNYICFPQEEWSFCISNIRKIIGVDIQQDLIAQIGKKEYFDKAVVEWKWKALSILSGRTCEEIKNYYINNII